MIDFNSLLKYFRNPGSTASQLETWRERILLIILRISAVGGFLIYLINIIREQQNDNWLLIGVYTAAFLWIALIAIFNNLPYSFRAVSFCIILFAIGIVSSLSDMYAGSNKIWFAASVLFSAILMGTRAGLISLILSTGSLFLLGYGFQMGWITSRKIGTVIQAEDFSIWASTGVTFFIIQAALVSALSAIITNLSQNLTQVTELSEELQQGKETLEKQTAELIQQTQYLEASENVTRAFATILDVDELYKISVRLLQERFNLHHVDIFEYQTENESPLLRGCTGDHRSDLVIIEGRENLVERSLRSQQEQLMNNISVADMPIGNIKLVTTRSAISIPLISRGHLIGAVVIQQESPEGFPDSLISVLKATSDQLAASLHNAYLFKEARGGASPDQPSPPGEWSKAAWREALQRRQRVGYYFDGQSVLPLQEDNLPQRLESNTDQEVITIPIQLYGQIVGHIEAVKSTSEEAWSDTEIDLLRTITERLEVAIDSARLYEETQKRAEGERIVGEVTTRLRETLDIDTVLRTAAAEMRSVFDLEEVEVRLTSPDEQKNTMEDENGS